MRKWMLGGVLLLFCAYTQGQQTKKPPVEKTEKNKTNSDTVPKVITDSALVGDMRDLMMDNMPTISLGDNDLSDGAGQNVSSVLNAGRDPFFSAASFNFSPARFRVRGYDNDLNITFMNGIPMDNLDNGFTPFGLWGGLNDVMRNRDLAIGLRYNTFSFGDLGSSTNIDARASKERKQTQFGYAFSNRNYNHRYTFYHGTGMSKKGWAFVAAGSFRGANEGYVPGTYFNGYSYFFGVDKRIGQKLLLSLVVFGAPTENGRQTAAIQEMYDITGDKYYNPAWGMQNGKKRNANVARTNQPVAILTKEYRFNNRTVLTSAVGFSKGDRSTSGIDWYNAPDPRPDYYRYLPSYQTNPEYKAMVTDAIRNDINLRQVNWQRMYDVNRISKETIQNVNGIAGNSVTGLRSKYILSENVNNTTRLNFNTYLNTEIGKHIEFMAGASYQYQQNHYFRRVNDLLGGDFFVDLNQFAERDFPSDVLSNQNDLNNPNRLLRKDDKYGYNYKMTISKAQGWAQAVFKFRKFDYFAAAEVSQTQFRRTGLTRTGIFPNNSFGESEMQKFTNYSFKGGITYKINGRNYLYVNGAYMTRAPFFENVYISPRIRDDVQDNVTSEKIQTIEGGYILNAPRLKVRVSGYYTRFDDQMNVLTFFNDRYNNFTNYAINNIDKIHFGGEFGFEARVTNTLTINGAASVGRYYFDSRQDATVTLNNNAEILAKETVFANNYRVSGTPQEAYSLGFQYRSPKFWFVSLTANFFDQMWLDFNPVRRTYLAVQDLPQDSEVRSAILAQERLKAQYTVDFFGGYSYKIPRNWGMGRNAFLVFNLGVNNLLNNQNIITGGFEQLRFDFDDKNPNKFPAKYFYAFGTNFFASVNLRF